MAYESFYRLDSLGPMRVMSGRRNGKWGYVFALGHDNATIQPIPDELKLWMEKSYHYPAELRTFNKGTGRFTAPCNDGSEHVLWRGGYMKSNLEDWRRSSRSIR
ncbi:hypothetical protein FRC08_009771 [Ceratobasidium sp. 394]|nr:hypothetical protein FRC08_009771 [Ceratobasidium sp. 394]KAG9088231.1 hypothetical protein FS749_002341 [Ceratobasidium sp. UAMH 11750]